MKIKKILAGITALCILYGALPASNQQKIFIGKTMTANAADSYSENRGTTENGLQYSINSDSERVRITGYSGSEKNVEIPASINGLPVTNIDGYAFENCTGLTEITIPDSVTSIGYKAFRGCTGLTEITIPNSVTSIGRYTFLGCTGLTEITIPNSVTSIGGSAFENCTGLTEITIPNSVTSIGSYAFSDCTGLTEITIPNSVTSIGRSAFSDCTGLTSITIPNSVTSIGSYAFSNTAWFDNQPDGLIYAGKVAYKYKGEMPENTELTLNENTSGITGSAFYGCTGLTSITIPNSVTSIGDDAFHDCTGLTEIAIPDSVTSIGEDAFYNTAWFENQPDGLVYAGKVAYKYKGKMPENTELILIPQNSK